MISFGTALKLLPKRGLTAKCRISRAEFWWDYLAIVLAMIVISILTVILPIFGILFLATTVLWVIISIRRVHDLDMSGWWVLFMLLPYLGGAIVLGMCMVKGNVGSNRFGPDPYAPGVIDDLLAPKQGVPMPQPMPQNFQPQPGFPQPQGGVQPQGFAQPQGFNPQGQPGFNQGYQQPAANQQPGLAQPQAYVQPNGAQPEAQPNYQQQ